MNVLSKLLPLFVLPVGVILLLLVLGLWTRRRFLIWAGVLLLWVSSTPLVAQALLRLTEGGAVRIAASDAPAADAIVVLSGGRVLAPGPARISEWNDPDRFFGGVELFHAGKAPVLVFTGGWMPWAPDVPTESATLTEYARALGVPADRILATGRVSNTADEAREVSALLRSRQATTPRVLLVTSAFHMPRARFLFERAGVEVVPFPVDFRGTDGGVGLLDFVPSATAMSGTQLSIREFYGRLYYRFLG